MTDDFAVRPGAADAVLAAARVRRFRRAVATGAVTLAVVAAPLLAGVLTAGDRDDSLTAVQPEATPNAALRTDTPSADPTPPAGSPPAGSPPAGSPPPARASSAPGRPTPAPGAQPVPGESPDAVGPAPDRPTSEPRPERRSAAAPITRGTSTIDTADLCDEGTTDPTRTGWCARYTGPASAKRGRPVVLSFELCRYPQAGDATVDYDSGLEVLAQVPGPGDQPRWRAGQGVTYPAAPHSEVVRAGTCVTWSSSWDTRGPDGFLVVPGEYQFTGGVNGTDGLPGATGSFQVVA